MDLLVAFDNDTMRGDLVLAPPDLATDDGLTTAVLISIFTDRQAEPDDTLPDDVVNLSGAVVSRGSGDRRGWWGDWYSPDMLDALRAQGQLAAEPLAGTLAAPTDRIGSRLWLLSREKQTPSVLARAKSYIEEALQWLLDDGVAASIDVACSFPETGRLAFTASIMRPSGAGISYRYAYVWASS
jgi:phage gp46-like protein